MINVKKLQDELKIAGIEILGCNSNGVVWDLNGVEIQNRSDVASVISAHVPTVATEITPSQQIILADGDDIATVTFRGAPGAVVEYTINNQAQNLTLDDTGIDTLELTCDTPNTTLLVQVGSARAVIFAVEVPS